MAVYKTSFLAFCLDNSRREWYKICTHTSLGVHHVPRIPRILHATA